VVTTQVQRVWRGRRAAATWRAKLRAQWDTRFTPLLSADAAPLPARVVFDDMLPPLLFLLSRQRLHAADAKRVRGVVGALLGSLSQPTVELNYAALAADPSLSDAWCRQVYAPGLPSRGTAEKVANRDNRVWHGATETGP
jgi:hypothetical protein